MNATLATGLGDTDLLFFHRGKVKCPGYESENAICTAGTNHVFTFFCGMLLLFLSFLVTNDTAQGCLYRHATDDHEGPIGHEKDGYLSHEKTM
jgi:hypothetical protein